MGTIFGAYTWEEQEHSGRVIKKNLVLINIYRDNINNVFCLQEFKN